MAVVVYEIGEKVSRWTILSAPVKYGKEQATAYVCECDCGTTKTVRAFQLRRGLSRSCGCLAAELSSERNRTHGMTKTPEFSTWDSMKDRCYSSGRRDAASYKAKGIVVCDRWLGKNGFENFYADMGKRPKGHTLDRIDNDGNYEPNNCRWATPKQQANNKSNTHIVEVNGIKHTLTGLAESLGIRTDTLSWRLENWSDMDKIINTPVKSWKYTDR